MTLDEFAPRLASFLTFWANLMVCAFAVRFYQRRPMRPVLLIAIACGLGAFAAVVPWIAEGSSASSRGFWYLTTLIGMADVLMWAVGTCWFFRECERQEHHLAPAPH